MAYRIVLVDDHAILTDGLKMIFRDDSRFEIIATTQSGYHALAFLKANHVDLIVVDYEMPDIDGLELIKRVKALDNHPKIIMLTMHDEASIIKEVISAGADGYVLKKSAMDELAIAMETVLNHRPYWSAEVGQKLFQSAKQSDTEEILTDREIDVLKLIIKELTNKEIATHLSISERTVEVHRKNLMRKVKCTNTVGLIKYAFAHQLL